MEGLFSLLASIYPITSVFRDALEKELIPLSLPKNYLRLEAPRIADHAYYLDRGFAITYTFIQGEKQIDDFWQSGQIIFSPKSLFEQIPTVENIQLIEPSEVICISYKSIMRLFELFPEANFIYRSVMNQYYDHARERIRDMKLLGAADRYMNLLHSFPGIEQFIPQEYIASYLGITPQSLSRIKRKDRP